MPRRVIDVDGARWTVSVSGRATQYGRDEFGNARKCDPLSSTI